MHEVGSFAEGKEMYIMGMLSGASSLSESKYSSMLNKKSQLEEFMESIKMYF